MKDTRSKMSAKVYCSDKDVGIFDKENVTLILKDDEDPRYVYSKLSGFGIKRNLSFKEGFFEFPHTDGNRYVITKTHITDEREKFCTSHIEEEEIYSKFKSFIDIAEDLYPGVDTVTYRFGVKFIKEKPNKKTKTKLPIPLEITISKDFWNLKVYSYGEYAIVRL